MFLGGFEGEDWADQREEWRGKEEEKKRRKIEREEVICCGSVSEMRRKSVLFLKKEKPSFSLSFLLPLEYTSQTYFIIT